MHAGGERAEGSRGSKLDEPEHSPLSRGLREFTESRRPLPPRRGRACCSSFAVARVPPYPPFFNPSPASPESTPKIQNTSSLRKKKKEKKNHRALRCEAILGAQKDTGRGSEYGETYRGEAGMARERREEERVTDGGKSNLRHLRPPPVLFPGFG